ncbi:MAG TPA: nucleotide exchange factor GrpE [Actinomycetota bacterium]|nr:nucleotide exchange factor GrpE [Actinomycetota bacterium]
MGEKDRTDEGRLNRPKVKVSDRRRFLGSGDSSEEARASSGEPRGDEEHEQTSGVERDVEAAKQEAAEYRDHLMRLQAEFDNYRKRVLKEQTRAVELASEPLVRRLLEVLDEFELALMAAEQRPDFEKFLHGVELVYAKLVETLKSEGLERIEAEGRPFDPERHEALMGSSSGEGDPLVADVLRQGYVLKGRVVRPAGVRVTHER